MAGATHPGHPEERAAATVGFSEAANEIVEARILLGIAAACRHGGSHRGKGRQVGVQARTYAAHGHGHDDDDDDDDDDDR